MRISHKRSLARRLLERALARENRALKALVKLRESSKDDTAFLATTAPLALDMKEAAIRIHLHIAHLFTSSQSYNRSLKWVNRALAIDPTHAAALADRARIELAISQN